MFNSWNKTLTKIWESYSSDVGKSLIHLGALGWVMSSAAQTLMIYQNKDIQKKEKQFLVPQEIADGAVNVGLYYTICQAIKKLGDNLLENAKIITPKSYDLLQRTKLPNQSIEEFLRNFDNKNLSTTTTKEKMSNFFNIMLSAIKEKENFGTIPQTIKENLTLKKTVTPLLETTKLQNTKNLFSKGYSDFSRFKNGVGVISISLSIITCNVITPVARNITANYFQKKALKKTITNNKKVVCNPKISRTYDIFKI